MRQKMGLLPYRAGFRQQLRCKDTTAQYCVYLSLRMSFFIQIKGCVNFHETTPVHKKCVLMR
jgi:hypothetical protein